MRIPEMTGSARFWWVGYAAWFVLLTILSSISGVSIESPKILEFDKILHAVYFAGGATALYVALYLSFSGLRGRIFLLAAIVILVSALTGWLDEWHQSFTPGRAGLDLGDWTADVVGGFLGVFIGRIVVTWIPGRAEFAPGTLVS